MAPVHRLCARAALAVILAAAIATPARVVAAQAATAETDASASLERARAAAQAFKSLEEAVRAGYARDGGSCVAHPPHGAMGYHHINASLLDDSLEVERPEILVYERTADGTYRLNGVEYVVPYRVRPRDARAPVVMGRPLKRSDALGLWYLHAWIFSENPNGVFADWHPGVRCDPTP